MYNEAKVKKSELLQLILLDNFYAQSGSQHVIFQGGTAIRWIYGGLRFSEDLDFVTSLSVKDIEKILEKTFQESQKTTLAQFGPGKWETKKTGKRKEAIKVLFIYRPETQRERIAVKLEFESLREGYVPEFSRFILRDLPSVAGLVTTGKLIMPYSSSIILAEIPEEIFSDKIRALYERKYLKGRDIYDIWWLSNQLGISPNLANVKKKLEMYRTFFIPAREIDYFQKKESVGPVIDAIERDLPRFIPQNIFLKYKENNLADLIDTLKDVTAELLAQGMKNIFKDYERREKHT